MDSRFIRSKKTWAAFLVAPLALTLTACGDDAEVKTGEDIVLEGETIATVELLEKCQDEGGEVVYYSSAPADTFEGVAEDFKDDTGINITHVRATSNELYSKVISEHAGGKVGGDILAVNDPSLRQDLYDKGIIVDFTIPNEEEVKKDIGDNPQIGFAKPSTNASQVIAWNTEKVDEADAPKSYEDLLDPKWKGKFAMTAVQTGLSSITVAKSIYDGLGLEKAKEFGEQEPKMFPSVVPLSQALVRGSVPVAITDVAIIRKYQEEGNPVDWIAPAEGTPTWGNGETLLKGAEHESCGVIWAAWSSSLEGAKSRWEHTLFLSPRLQTPENLPDGAPDLGTIYEVDTSWLLKNRDAFVKEWSSIVPQS